MSISMKREHDGQHADDISTHLPRTLAVHAHLNARTDIRYLVMSLKQDIEGEKKVLWQPPLRAPPHILCCPVPLDKLVLFNMATIASLKTATSMIYYSAQRYDPRLRQQQQQATLLPTTPLLLLGHLPTSFTASRIIYPPSVFSRFPLLTRSGTPTLSQDGSTTSSSNRGSSSQTGRISALTNTTIFELGETSSKSVDGDDPVLAKEPGSGERQTPSIESMLSAIKDGARVITPPPSSVIRQYDDTVKETDTSGKDEILEQVSSVIELPDLAMGISNSPSKILDQHPDYDSLYDCSEDNETISDFFVGQDPDDQVGDTYSFGQSISLSDIQESVTSNRANDASLPTRPPSVVSSSNSSIRFRPTQPSSASSSISSIRFRPMESHQQATVLPHVYEQRAQKGTAVSSRRVSFADPVSVPSSPLPRAHKAIAWWKIKQLKKSSKRFHFGPSKRRHPESTKPDVPSQPTIPAANSIATSVENVETHPSRPRSPAPSMRHRRIGINFRRVVSAVLPCIPLSQEPDESEKDEPKEKPRSNGVHSMPSSRQWEKHENNVDDETRDMVEVKTLQVQVNRRVVVH